MESTILYRVDGDVAIIALNRPERRNAMTPQMFAELSACLEETAKDSAVRAVIITGSGRAFCSGGDIAGHPNFGEPNPAVRQRNIADGQAVLERVASFPKPTIAAINGAAVAAGADLTLACDFRVAAEEARIIFNYIDIGLMSDFGASYFLPRVVGSARAREILMLGEPISAERALEWGLVNRVVAGPELAAASLELARRLTAKSPIALTFIKEAIDGAIPRDLHSALAVERYGQNLLLGTEELMQKAAAFREKSQSKG